MRSNSDSDQLSRRGILQAIVGLGIGSSAFARALAAEVDERQRISAEMIAQAEWVADIELAAEERELVARSVERLLRDYQKLRSIPLTNDVPPAVMFHVQPRENASKKSKLRRARPLDVAANKRPSDEDVAFFPISELSALIRTKQISSVDLTKLYLDRLNTFDPQLHCVVTFTEDLAMRQAKRADSELARGRYRGPLHGIPWGAKDLIAVPGYPTTWGAPRFKDRVLDETATVAKRLEDAGAVLIAKLSLGAIAMGDKWFGGMTRNPWNTDQGSSGSSAGSAAATAAGLVGFTLGSETLGSIVSPSRRCATTGLRPTYGRVSRFGCMTLAWSMDKIGPICRSVEDCALVLDAVRGRDGLDSTAVDAAFTWPPQRDVRTLKIGYVEGQLSAAEKTVLDHFKSLNCELVPIKLPTLPAWAMTLILDAESACAFDELLRENDVEGLNTWPRTWRQAQFIPAIEYLRANRVRTLLQREMNELFDDVNLYLGGEDLAMTNFTGHPSIVIPAGPAPENRQPLTAKLTGQLFQEETLLSVAHTFQSATTHHLQRPNLVVGDTTTTKD